MNLYEPRSLLFFARLKQYRERNEGGPKPWPALLCRLSNQANCELLISIRSSNTWNLCITYTVVIVIVVWKYDALRLNNLYCMSRNGDNMKAGDDIKDFVYV